MTKKATWSVAVLYQDADARRSAMDFCDQMVERFWGDVGFQIDWWAFDFLTEANTAREATAKAASADLLIFATQSEDELPLALRGWLEGWLKQRGTRKGLVVKAGASRTPTPRETDLQRYLSVLARRAGMEYVTELPTTLPGWSAEFPELYTERAHQVTSLLEEILHQHRPPSSGLS